MGMYVIHRFTSCNTRHKLWPNISSSVTKRHTTWDSRLLIILCDVFSSMDAFTTKRWIPANKRCLMIRIIVDDMISKRHGQRPTRAQLCEVAQKIVDEYPLSFQETEPFGNKPFATNGCAVLFQQLENKSKIWTEIQTPRGQQQRVKHQERRRPGILIATDVSSGSLLSRDRSVEQHCSWKKRNWKVPSIPMICR